MPTLQRASIGGPPMVADQRSGGLQIIVSEHPNPGTPQANATLVEPLRTGGQTLKPIDWHV